MQGLTFSQPQGEDPYEVAALDAFQTQGVVAIAHAEKSGLAGLFHHRSELRQRCAPNIKLVLKMGAQLKNPNAQTVATIGWGVLDVATCLQRRQQAVRCRLVHVKQRSDAR
jgi:hypothetical protein